MVLNLREQWAETNQFGETEARTERQRRTGGNDGREQKQKQKKKRTEDTKKDLSAPDEPTAASHRRASETFPGWLT